MPLKWLQRRRSATALAAPRPRASHDNFKLNPCRRWRHRFGGGGTGRLGAFDVTLVRCISVCVYVCRTLDVVVVIVYAAVSRPQPCMTDVSNECTPGNVHRACLGGYHIRVMIWCCRPGYDLYQGRLTSVHIPMLVKQGSCCVGGTPTVTGRAIISEGPSHGVAQPDCRSPFHRALAVSADSDSEAKSNETE